MLGWFMPNHYTRWLLFWECVCVGIVVNWYGDLSKYIGKKQVVYLTERKADDMICLSV